MSDDALELVLPADLFKKYEKFRFERALQSDKDFCRCLTPDCENGVIIARDAGLPGTRCRSLIVETSLPAEY